jgi:CheY-like chemotaxis protein
MAESTRRQRILVVEDDEDVREPLAAALCQSGYAVSTASDGLAALSAFARCPADLVLADYLMPGMDGLELIRRIRVNTPRQPALLLTGWVGDDVPADGVTQCLRKPISLDDLVWAVDCTLACSESPRPRTTTTPVFRSGTTGRAVEARG